MKRIIIGLIILTLFLICPLSVSANTYDEVSQSIDTDKLIDELPENSKQILLDLGISSADYKQINDVKLQSIINEFSEISKNQIKTPLKTLISVIGVMLFYSILYSFKSSLKTTSMEQMLSICITLCLSCMLIIPVCDVITNTINIISSATKFILAYIPIMFVIMSVNGHSISGASYYSLMIFAGQGVTQVSSNIIAPFLKLYLGISVTSALSPNINIKGFIDFIQKIIKWLLGFIMTIFTALLTFKQLITTPMDNVSTRAVRFTLNSLIPIVGSALSDAYKTVQSSVGLLKSGVGVFVIIAVFVVFLPSLIQCIIWIFTLNAGKSIADILDLKEASVLLSSVTNVLTTIFAILLCIMSIYIISTALILLIGGVGV